MGTGRSGLFYGTKGGKQLNLHEGRQGKHIIGHNNYIPGKSIFFGSLEDAQQLVREFAGKGITLPNGRERVNFGRIIGYYVDQITHEKIPTTWGIIHYSQDGVHIVPSKPYRR